MNLTKNSLQQQTIIEQTQCWVETLIVGHNICPFARREVQNASIRYVVSSAHSLADVLALLVEECHLLDDRATIETTLLIFPTGYEGFYDYLQLVDLANQLMFDQGYNGIYQLATMHPDYCFEGERQDDPANYTNRSPYPMLHLIREASIEKALMHYKAPESIPSRNIAYARDKGNSFFVQLLADCMRKHE